MMTYAVAEVSDTSYIDEISDDDAIDKECEVKRRCIIIFCVSGHEAYLISHVLSNKASL